MKKIVEEWYLRKDVVNFLLKFSKNREFVPMFEDGSFGKRPFTLQYEQDIIELVNSSVVSFHCSVERWLNVSMLRAGMSKEDLDNLRIGFDFIIDPDTKDFLIAKDVVKGIIECLKDHGVKSFLIKFSGGKSFHIFIPYEAIPKMINFKETTKMFPEIYRILIEYMKEYCRDIISARILSSFDISELCEIYNLKINDLIENNEFNPYSIINLDVFSHRHLYRSFYSLHEKTLLVSVPVDVKDLDKFDKTDASVERVKVVDFEFKDTNDAEILFIEALDWFEKNKEKFSDIKIKAKTMNKKIKKEIPEKYFPPCIKNILNGLEDGRKRGLFLLINFLKKCGYDNEKIMKIIDEWNKKNKTPLPDRYVLSQAKYYLERREEPYVLPSCNRSEYYDDTKFCTPDMICQNKNIKNPINYVFKKIKNDKSN
ncbi:MAG: hypothetical protein RMJ17_02975 [Candidatus Aenigmarchaeota archaeon]|nr:hypothetical protein [Candidatus Aenigmarchaeota archaeon]MDW8149530.1 hypothetical protein [Candidatus Aenigmarchaeota archaeon]